MDLFSPSRKSERPGFRSETGRPKRPGSGKNLVLAVILIVVVLSLAVIYSPRLFDPADNSFTYRTERIDQPSTDANGTPAYLIDGKTYSEEDLRREVFEVAAINGSVSFKRVYLETVCQGDYKVVLTRKENVLSIDPAYSGGGCDRYSARYIEGTVSGIAPGKYIIRAAGMSRDFEAK